jgi:hypothetical protein
MQVLLLQPASHNLVGLLRDLELNGPAGLPLHDSSSGSHPLVESYIVDPERDEVTSVQLAVDRQIEKGQIPNAMRHLESDPNGPDFFDFESRLGSNQLAPVQSVGAAGIVSDSVLYCSAPETKPPRRTLAV